MSGALTACTDIITATEIGHSLGIRYYSLEDALTTCIDVHYSDSSGPTVGIVEKKNNNG